MSSKREYFAPVGVKYQMACKPGSVLACARDDHSSGMPVTGHL